MALYPLETMYGSAAIRLPVSCLGLDGVLFNEQGAAPSITSIESTAVHMGAAVKCGGEQDGVND